MELGVYIHYPWCRSRCPYCDFPIAVAPLAEIPHERYLTAILDELAVRAEAFSGRRLVSIYVGGGTPSLWPAACLARAFAEVARALGPGVGVESLEVTIEANPSDCTPENLAGWKGAGVNRLSIGVQSVDADDLVALGRDHRMGQGLEALDAADAAGFDRVSADLILGQAGAREPLGGVRALAARGLPHLSVYELTIEPGTPLARQVARGEARVLDDDRLADLYLGADAALTAAGYEHYEISSYARPGARAVHNSLYWRGQEYLGLGAGASSFWCAGGGGEAGARSRNHRSVGRYLAAAPRDRIAEREALSPADLAADRVWLGLRTRDGVPAAALDGHPRLLEWLLAAGLVEHHAARIRPTLHGFLYSNQVARRVLEEFRYSSSL